MYHYLLSFLPLAVNQVEHIFLSFSTEPHCKVDREAIVKQLLEQYNSRAEKIGLKNFVISTRAHHASDAVGNMECFTTMIQREVRKYP